MAVHHSHIVHFFDDDKFIDNAIRLFEEAAPGKSRYYVIKQEGEPFRHVKSLKAERVSLQRSDEPEFIAAVSANPIFFFHGLNEPKQRLVNRLPESAVKVWFVWGYDLYSTWKPFRHNIYEKRTAAFAEKYLKKNTLKEKILVNPVTFAILKAMRKRDLPLPAKVKRVIRNSFGYEYYEAVHKIDIVAPVVPTEYKFVQKIGISPKLAPFSYGSMDDYILDFSAQVSGNDILVGNSGDPSNNHVDVFYRLSRLSLGNRKIIVPLNYACPPVYRDFVIRKGSELLGENFMPLLHFMPLDEYNKLVSSCGVVIFNHIRQQALGNLLVQGFLGAKLFLNPKSPVFDYFRQRDVRFFSIDELGPETLETDLDAVSRERNREAFTEMYGRAQVLEKVDKLLEIVYSELNAKQHA